MDLSKSALRAWQDILEENAAGDGMRFLSRFRVARGEYGARSNLHSSHHSDF
jgi:hypothetical protein